MGDAIAVWSDLTKQQRIDLVVGMLKDDPSLTYEAVGRRLGVPKGAIAGIMFRAGLSKPMRVPEIHPNTHPVIRDIFMAAYRAGMTDNQLAMKTGYTKGTLWYLRNNAADGRLRTIADLATAVGLRLEVVSNDANHTTNGD